MDRPLGIEHVSGHDSPVLGERPRQRPGEFQTLKVVTICDYLGLFILGQLEPKIGREPALVASDRLVEHLGWHAVECCQVRVQHNPVPPDPQNGLVDSSRGDQHANAGGFFDCWLYASSSFQGLAACVAVGIAGTVRVSPGGVGLTALIASTC